MRAPGFNARVRWLLALAVAVAAVMGVAGAPGRGQDSTGATSRLVAYESEKERLTMEYPARWHRSGSRLFPPIVNPRSLVALATQPIPDGAGRGECGYMPSQLRRAVADDGAAVAVTELLPSPGRMLGKLRGRTPARPSRFQLRHDAGYSTPGGRGREWMLHFQEDDRVLTVAVVLGRHATAETRREALAVLDSLRFEPRSPAT